MHPAARTYINLLVAARRLAATAGLDDYEVAACIKAADDLHAAPDEVAEQAILDGAAKKLTELAKDLLSS